jgi:hypothetical protein
VLSNEGEVVLLARRVVHSSDTLQMMATSQQRGYLFSVVDSMWKNNTRGASESQEAAAGPPNMRA